MDLRDQIEEYLATKKYARGTCNSYRSILQDFNVWQMHRPAMRMSEKVCEYDRFIRENCFRKPKTADKQAGAVRRFCVWLEETGRVEAFKLDEQLVGRPEMRSVPEAPIGRDELMQVLNVISRTPSEHSLRDAAIFALAVTCGLTAPEISSLNMGYIASDFRPGSDELRYCGKTIPLPRVTSLLLGWYIKDKRPQRGTEPLFTTSRAEDGCRLSADEVKDLLKTLLSLVGVTYEDAVPGDCQFRIAQHFKNLGQEGRRAAAMAVQVMAYEENPVPNGFTNELRRLLAEGNARIARKELEEFMGTFR